jgi:hypothetical protein
LLLPRSIPYLGSNDFVLDLDQLGSVLKGDCWHDVGGYFVFAEAVENVGFADSNVSN